MHLPLPGVFGLLRQVRAWPQSSQDQARRNAMLAATACAQRRIEHQEVEDYLAWLAAEVENDVRRRQFARSHR